MEYTSPVIITGHYGSGKTEFSANLALYMKERGSAPVVADLDIVNPYFRIRELKDSFSEKGIKVISSNYEDEYYLDMPALAASLRSCFEENGACSIVDVGGDPAGATALAQYAHLISGRDYSMWMVVNANRPQTQRADEVCGYIEETEKTSRLKINGLVNNTHLLKETTAEDIMRGDALIREVSALTGLPVVCTCAEERLTGEIKACRPAGEIFGITPMIRPDWL